MHSTATMSLNDDDLDNALTRPAVVFGGDSAGLLGGKIAKEKKKYRRATEESSQQHSSAGMTNGRIKSFLGRRESSEPSSSKMLSGAALGSKSRPTSTDPRNNEESRQTNRLSGSGS